MTGLLDIARPRETVSIGKQQIEVCGITAKGIADLLGRFPELRKMLTGANDPGILYDIAPRAFFAIVAGGLGKMGDAATETEIGELPAEAAADLFAAVVRVTMPSGFRPFVDRMARVFNGQQQSPGPAGVSGKTPATK